MKLTKRDIAALLAFACEDEARYHVSVVHFEPEHGRAVATDGHSLVIYEGEKGAPDSDLRPFSVSRADMVKLYRIAGAKDDIHVTADALTVGAQTLQRTPCDGHFPAYRQVLAASKQGPCPVFAIQTYLLSRLELVAKAAASKSKNDGAVVLKTGAGEFEPLHFETVSGPRWSGVLMPFRI